MRYYDDLNVGSGWLVGTYVASRAEAIELATRWEPQPYHVDERAAAESVYGGLTLCSLHLFAICTRLFLQQPNPIAVTAMLGKDEVRLPKAARPAEEIRNASQISGSKSSSKAWRSRSRYGVC